MGKQGADDVFIVAEGILSLLDDKTRTRETDGHMRFDIPKDNDAQNDFGMALTSIKIVLNKEGNYGLPKMKVASVEPVMGQLVTGGYVKGRSVYYITKKGKEYLEQLRGRTSTGWAVAEEAKKTLVDEKEVANIIKGRTPEEAAAEIIKLVKLSLGRIV